MKITQSEKKDYKKGERGIANVSIMEGDKIRLTILSSGNEYNLRKEDLPDYFPFRVGRQFRAYVTLDGDSNKILYANPATGDYKSRLHHINKDGEIPAIITRNGADGKYLAFDTFHIITEGSWMGACGVHFLNPQFFKEDEDGNLWINGFGKNFQNLSNFMEVTGVANVNIPFSENPLPEIQKMALEIGKEYMASYGEGKIQSLSDYFSLENDDEEIGFTEKQKENVEIPEALKD